MNEVRLIGYLGKAPEIIEFSSGAKKADASLCTSKVYYDKQDVKTEKKEWHRLVIWGKKAESFAKYAKKGSRVHISGEINYRSYDKEGTTIYITEINVQSFILLDKKEEETLAHIEPEPQPEQEAETTQKATVTAGDDLPF